ncbi:transmembrane protein 94-like [Orbicella faveolata]|uniref:transmembrane protein 94-like n=1 Tax=Orbicella faveolata TaxID=48498 RepID=UPI0009E3859A|nr:transmembrane protein 94-like [Orbicella faveolata]
MISIMQDYGEVVCCVGSSFNSANPAIFIQADISIAVEPLFPQLCLKGLPKDFRSGTPKLGHENTREKLHRRFSDEQSTEEESELSPLELSAFLNALPCSLAFHRDASFEFKDLIKEARRLCFGLRNCFSFMLSCQLVLSAVMFLSSCFLLPPPFTGLHLLWLSCLIVPLLSLSLIGSPADQGLMTMITGKNDRNFKDITHTVCFFFSVCFVPSICICCFVLFPLNLHGICLSRNQKSTSCHFLFGFRNSTELWNGLGQSHIQALALAQDINVFFLVLLFGMFVV